MIAGPVFIREVVTAPRRARLYVSRVAYVGALLVLLSTAWQVLTGTRNVEAVGDLARFGSTAFALLVPLQLAVGLFFAALAAAGSVSAEKDRRTLELLLLTRLSNADLVLGKLLASLLHVLALIAAAVPLFMIAALLGGVSFAQIGRVFAVVFASAVAAGSLGSTIALWREKTFQSLAATLLLIVLWLALGEALAAGAFGRELGGADARLWAEAVSPWRATLAATRPPLLVAAGDGGADRLPWIGDPVHAFWLVAAGLTLLTNGIAIALVRVWNPSREMRLPTLDEDEPVPQSAGAAHHWHLAPRPSTDVAPVGDAAKAITHAAAPKVGTATKEPAAAATDQSAPRRRARTRAVWDNPILWREMRTWAYGRRMLLVRLAYLAIFAACGTGLYWTLSAGATGDRIELALPIVPLAVLSLVLVNVQSVTAITSERDARALDLLLVTDLTPREFIFGKLGGALYNTKEMVLLPIALFAYLMQQYVIGLETLLFLTSGWLVMVAFVAMLGVHCGMTYAHSRAAIAVSVGTVFFLFVGVATCMRIMVAFSGQFQYQLQPFLAFMVGGGVGLLVALGWRNASSAIWVASFASPFATFYALTSFLLGNPLAVFLVVAITYGFATAAMLIPAIHEFDVATGRTTGDDA